MKVLGLRFCSVSDEAEKLAGFLRDGLGLPTAPETDAAERFQGAVFPAGESWIEIWPEAPGMAAGIMLQIVVDDAEAWAERARANGLEPHGPTEVHGERIYFLQAPTGLAVTIQSKLARDEGAD